MRPFWRAMVEAKDTVYTTEEIEENMRMGTVIGEDFSF